MPVERVRLVLRQHAEPEHARVDEVRQHEVDQPVLPPNGTAAWPGRRSAASVVCLRPRRGRWPGLRIGHSPCRPAPGHEPAPARLEIAVRSRMLTREFPPDVYGGAGVHVDILVRELRTHRSTSTSTASASRAPTPSPIAVARRPGRRRTAALQTLGVDLAMVAAAAGGDVAPLAHLVRQPGRPPRRAAARRPARGDRALPRTAPTVEGGAARRRLPGLVVGRAHRLRGRRRRHRGEPRHARRRARPLPHGRPRPRARRPQRHRHRRLPPRPRHRRARASYGIDPDAAVRAVRRADHPAEGRRRTCCAAARRFDPDVQLVLCAGVAGHPGDRRGDRGGGRGAARARAGRA